METVSYTESESESESKRRRRRRRHVYVGVTHQAVYKYSGKYTRWWDLTTTGRGRGRDGGKYGSPGVMQRGSGFGTGSPTKNIKQTKRIEICLYDDDDNGKLDNDKGTRRHVIGERHRESNWDNNNNKSNNKQEQQNGGRTVHGITRTPTEGDDMIVFPLHTTTHPSILRYPFFFHLCCGCRGCVSRWVGERGRAGTTEKMAAGRCVGRTVQTDGGQNKRR